MIKTICAFIAATLLLPAPAISQTGAPLTTLPVGRYKCSLPGDAGGPAWRPIEGMIFSIKNASRYLSPEGTGTYLMRGHELVFTRGPMKDQRYKRMGSSILRKIGKDGTLGKIRCVRSGPLQ
ncbi:elongation factor P [Altererythrobacter sp.]|nr:elongation factor P [Altererythrobacter sp.]